MLTFKELQKTYELSEEYINNQYETADELFEALITFGGQAYPKFGNVVIMAGGAGSGKGFVKDNLVGMEGKVFDVDALKTLAASTAGIKARVKKELGVDLGELSKNLKTPENVAKLHEILSDYLNLPDKQQKAFLTSVITAAADRKPNIIFDVTLKDLRKLQKIASMVEKVGYKKENIHIVWVVNDIEVAKKQNAERDRTVPVEILVNTHRGASNTMYDVLNMGQSLAKYMDGDIVFAFNKVGVDANLSKSGNGGQYIKDANYFYVKRKGKPSTPVKDLAKEIVSKISKYVPKNASWE